MTLLQEFVRSSWWFVLGILMSEMIMRRTNRLLDWLQQPRKPIVLNRLVESIERDSGRRCGILMISPRDFRMLMRDLKRHNDPVIRSGNGQSRGRGGIARLYAR